MSESFLSFGFSAGVLSPSLHGRTDLDKFGLALKRGVNWLIDYRGGASVRPGFEFIDYVEGVGEGHRLVPFEFNSALGNTYILVFSDLTVRFIQDGEYIRETGISVTSITLADPAVVTTSGAHSYADGDWVRIVSTDSSYAALVDRTYIVSSKTSTTFELTTMEGDLVDTSAFGAFSGTVTVERVYTVMTPYTEANLANLCFDHYRDELYITSTDYTPRKLVRSDAASWALSELTFEGNTTGPDNLVVTDTYAAFSGALYAVTAVDQDDKESPIGSFYIIETSGNWSSPHALKCVWDAVAGTKYYNVYRGLFYENDGDKATTGDDLGYIGRTTTTQFADNNVIPDFTKRPPTFDNPFANEAILTITITAGGSGYTKNGTTVSITGGTGFTGLAIVDDTGEVIGVRLLTTGQDYDGGTLSFSGSGTGATASFTVSPSSGNNPNCTARHEQRRWYAGTENLPMTFYATRPGTDVDFTLNTLGNASAPLDYALDSTQLSPIKFLAGTPLGMFMFTTDEIWQVRGLQDSTIQAGEMIAEKRTKHGVGEVPPLLIDDNMLYIQQGSQSLREFSPSQLRNFYELKERSTYATQYFRQHNQVESWCYAGIPSRTVWMQRENGTLVSMTYVPEQNVYAFSDHKTEGLVKAVTAVREAGVDRVYALIERIVDGTARLFLERLTTGVVKSAEDLGAVDCGVFSSLTAQSGTVTPAAASGTGVTVTASTSVFSIGNVGDHIRCGEGLGVIASYVSATEVTVDWTFPVLDLTPESDELKSYSTWYLDTPTMSVTNLHHLEGKTVQIFADGVVQDSKVVSGGAITLDTAATFWFIGLQYTGILETLQLRADGVVLDDKKARVIDAALRTINTEGLEISSSSGQVFYDVYTPTYRDYTIYEDACTEIQDVTVTAVWEDEEALIVRKTKPRLATLVGLILNTEIGE